MPLKQFTIDLQELATHEYLRFDEKFWYTTKNLAVYDHEKLESIFDLINGNSYTRFYSEERTKMPCIRIGNLSFKYKINDNNLMYLDESCEINENKKLKKNDLILATIGATIGKINLVRKFKGGTFSNNTVLLRLRDENKHNPLFYEKLFQCGLMQKYIWGVASQKAQPNLQTYNIQNIKIPKFSKAEQDKIVSEIEPIEKKIKELKNAIVSAQEVMNNVFAKEFGFDLKKVYEIDNDRNFYINLSQVKVNNNNLRSSCRWNQLKRIQKELYRGNKDIESLGKFIKNTKNGWSPECNGDENGTVVLGIDSIQKTGNLVFDNLKYTQKTRSNLNNYFIKNGNFFVSRGNTLDLVALASIAKISNAKNFIYSDLMIKVELDEEQIDKKYLAFVFNSIVGRIYFKYSAKGKNQTMVKISSKELYDFDLPVPKLKKQQKIVDEIKVELDRQENIKNEIETQRNKIDEIIEKAIK